MKNFGVEVKFRAYLKITWRAGNPGGGSEFDRLVPVDVTEDLEVQRQTDPKTGAFVSGQLFNRATGRVQVVLDDASSCKMVKKALAEARVAVAPKPLQYGKKPSKRRT